ncbi:MAG: DUF4153 domain-containing protein [Lachnospiraceae bacterium]|nr:DUF4153 domain-containing protein [Lachnospiraceae bacterium]
MDTQEIKTDKKQNRILKALSRLGAHIYEVFKDYPATMIAIIAAAFLGAILAGDNMIADDYEEEVVRIIGFFLIFSFQAIMYEEVFKNRLKIRIAGYALSSVISFVSVYILSYEDEILFGTSADTVREISARILFVYGVVMTGCAVYHMFKRLEEDFEVYCTKAFLELIKASVVYGLFAIGLGIIVFIFNELIYDTDDFVWQLELFLAGGIYTPMCIKAISSKNERAGKFARLCITYVLFPMLLIALAIIYIYIVKIFVTDTVPSNRVFDILAFLFSIGMPVWTMLHALLDKTGQTEEKQQKGFSKAAVFIPYAFIPFIILQCWSIGIRIKDYGFTTSRYSAVVLIIAEIIYFILYAIHHRGKKHAISWILFALMAISFLAIIMPGTSYDDVVIRSQTKRIEKMIDNKKLTDKEKSAIKSAYRAIDRVGYKGENALNKRFSKAQIDEIKEYSDYNDWHSDKIYPYYSNSHVSIDISEYSKLTSASSTDNRSGLSTYEYEIMTINKDKERQLYKVDISKIIEWIDANGEKGSRDLDLTGREKIRIDDRRDFFITRLNMTYDLETKEAQYVSLDGYILER